MRLFRRASFAVVIPAVCWIVIALLIPLYSITPRRQLNLQTSWTMWPVLTGRWFVK
jgi:hypothetical protein